MKDFSLPIFGFDDKVSSVVNNTDTAMCLFVGRDFTSISYRSEPHSSRKRIKEPFDNSISSIAPCPKS